MGAVTGALITVAGAFAFWIFVEKRLKERESADHARDKRTELAFSVSREASEIVGKTFWSGQNALWTLEPEQRAKANAASWEGKAAAEQIVMLRSTYARAITEWRVSSGTWALLMKFFDSARDSPPRFRWETLNGKVEEYLECVDLASKGKYVACLEARRASDFVQPPDFECDCTHFRTRIEGALEEWSQALREAAGKPPT